MKLLVFMMGLLVSALAAPAPQSESNEQAAAHANEALRWMELYRLYEQQGLVRNPFLPASHAPVNAAPADVPPPAPRAVEDASEEEAEHGHTSPRAAAPPNSDEAEEAEAAAEAAPADEPAAAAEPAGGDVTVVAAAAVDADVVSADTAPAAPEAVDAVAPAAAAAPDGAAEGDAAGVAADPAPV